MNAQADRLEQEQNEQNPPQDEAQDSQPPVNLHYLGPDEYYTNRMAYISDPSGNLIKDSVLLPHLPNTSPNTRPANDAGYVGPDACAECHKENYDGFMQTAHSKTSALATKDSIHGSFDVGKNRLSTSSPNLNFEMVERDGKLFQRMLLQIQEQTSAADFPFDIVTGSGKVGQTYLYFQGENLYQLHASYLTSTDSWMNSPGYADGVADFARPVLIECLECHSTFYDHYENTANQFRKENAVLGITCEKCHGPGREHVEFHRTQPESKESKGIVNPAKLTAERSLEVCQICHGGPALQRLLPPFSYRPGNKLADHYVFPEVDGDEAQSGIHTNTQLPRLKKSKCFTESESMTCIDCHNPHQHERGNIKLFSQRCIQCHEPQVCGKFETLGEQLADNCIDCHMLNLEMSDIRLMSDGNEFVPKMRDHYIKVWEEASDTFLKSMDEN